jgi:K+-sensing histidine kinase KdpD
MFGKLQNTSQINTSGIGLGLFICKRICESFDGFIRLNFSAPDIGSEFCFSFKTNGFIAIE